MTIKIMDMKMTSLAELYLAKSGVEIPILSPQFENVTAA
jgi:hypothetical protein